MTTPTETALLAETANPADTRWLAATANPAENGLLAGRVGVVTGAGRGIGAAIARRFAQHGAAVVVADIDDEAARSTAASIAAGPATGIPVEPMELDVTDEHAVETAFEQILSRHGRLDCAVANAGVLHLEPVVTLDLADWQRVLDVNLTGTFLTVRAAARRMVRGSIIVTSSLFGLRGGTGNGAYSASKFGVVGLAQSLAAEMARAGVRVNCVCPGQITTSMLDDVVEAQSRIGHDRPAATVGDLASRIPSGRLGTPDDIADACLFLASDLSSYVTGQSLVVDGGWQVG